MEICYLENGEGNKSNNKIHWFNKKFCQKVGGLKKEKKKNFFKNIKDKGGKFSFRHEQQSSLTNLLFWFLTFAKLSKLLCPYRKD